MTEITIFKNALFGEIRTMTDEKGETFFVGKDVAMALGYSNTRDALCKHVDAEDKTTVAIRDTGSNYTTQIVIINESGLYSLILSSKLPQAKKFKSWVTGEVLPQIRKTGGYIPTRNLRTGEALTDEDIMNEAERIVTRTLVSRNQHADGCITTTDIAKAIGMETHDLNSLLIDKGVQAWRRGQFRLTPQYDGRGLAQDRLFVYYAKDGKHKERTYLVWTQKGADFIREMLHKNG